MNESYISGGFKKHISIFNSDSNFPQNNLIYINNTNTKAYIKLTNFAYY